MYQYRTHSLLRRIACDCIIARNKEASASCKLLIIARVGETSVHLEIPGVQALLLLWCKN